MKHKLSIHLKRINHKLVRFGQYLCSVLYVPPSTRHRTVGLSSQFVKRETGDMESGVLGGGVVPVRVQHRASGPWAERGGRTGRAALRSCGLVLFWKQSKYGGIKLRGWEDGLN